MQPINQTINTSRGIITIREAMISDAAQFRELRLHALQNAPTAFSADYQKNANQSLNYWESRLEKDENSAIFFAEYAGELIGMMGIGRGQSAKTKHSAGIWGVYVRPEWRGLHIAEALIECCIDWAKSQQVNILKLAVVTISTSAVRCYERCGFKTYGTEPQAVFYEGRYYDEYLMSRNLNIP
jgi:RimJ/RimL family protein N-acetyltransferase